MQSKSLLIAIAAFAVTTTGVQAYGNGRLLEQAQLSDEQKAAIEAAHELRQQGDITAARDTLIQAGIAEPELASVRAALFGNHGAKHYAQNRHGADQVKSVHDASHGTAWSDQSQRHWWDELSDEQQAAFLVAKQSNDRKLMYDILAEAGVANPKRAHQDRSWHDDV